MINLTLKRTSGNPIPIHSVNPIEDVGKEKVSSSEMMEIAFEEYLKGLTMKAFFPDDKKALVKFPSAVLKPEEIIIFKNLTFLNEDHEKYLENTGLFISGLIQNSFDAGHNDFVFEKADVWNFGYYLKGREDRTLDLTIKEVLGKNKTHVAKVAAYSSYIRLDIVNDYGSETAKEVAHSIVNVELSKGNYFCDRAEYSTINVGAIYKRSALYNIESCNVRIGQNFHEDAVGSPLRSDITIVSNQGYIGKYAYQCKFRSKSKKTLDSLGLPRGDESDFFLLKDGISQPYSRDMKIVDKITNDRKEKRLAERRAMPDIEEHG